MELVVEQWSVVEGGCDQVFVCPQGMSVSVLGPTFNDLAQNVNSSISNISYIIVGRATGGIGGCLIGGILFEWMNPHLLLGKPSPTGVCRHTAPFSALFSAFIYSDWFFSSCRIVGAAHCIWDVCHPFL